MRREPDRGSAHDHLEGAEPEYLAAHHAQAIEGQLQPNGEQQKRDPQIGERLSELGALDPAERVRSGQDAGGEIAEDLAGAQPA
jgi:hypothetical protein